METQHIAILKRVGTVLLVIGLIDIALMIYSISNRISYSSSFNVFAVIAGIFLLRGSLRAASIVRWFAVFLLVALAGFLVIWLFLQPLSLTLAQLRLFPGSAFSAFAFVVFVMCLLAWLTRELGREPVLEARVRAGRKLRDMRIPAAAGVGLVVLMSLFLTFLLGGESAEKARSIAEQQVGPGYRFYVSSLNVAKNSQGTSVSSVVTAWNDNEIRAVPVQWTE